MKICYLGVMRDGTGYSSAAVNNILALESNPNFDVVCRSVSLSQSHNYELAKKIKHLEEKSLNNVDVIISHILPHFFEYKYGVKNIGYFDWEATNFSRSNWTHCCNIMDEIWVPCLQNYYACKNSGVEVPIKIWPHSCDLKEFENLPDKFDSLIFKDKCVFYTIGEFIRRKNFSGLVRAYYSTFTKRDDVVLILKTNITGQSSHKTFSAVKKMIEDIKKSTHIYIKHDNYPIIIPIIDYLTEEQMKQLHTTGDIFVSSSRGEAWCMPAMQSLACGNPLIVPNWGSFPELMCNNACDNWVEEYDEFILPDFDNHPMCGWLIDGHLTPCFGSENFPDLYTGDSLWFDPDLNHLSKCMKIAYDEWKNKKLQNKTELCKKIALKFDLENVGKIAEELLK